MSHRTRYFMVGSIVVVSACLCTGLVAYYNGSLPLRGSNLGPVEMTYLPTDTTAIAFANVHDIMASEVRQKLRQVLPSGQEKDRLLAEIGLDIEHDIESVVASATVNGPGVKGPLVLVRGHFNTSLMESTAVQHGATTEDYQGRRLLLADAHAHAMPADGSTKPVEPFTGCLAFLEPGLIAIGDAAAIRRGIDANASHDDATKNDELMKMVLDAENGGNVWAVGRYDEMMKSGALPVEISSHIPAVKWFLVSAHVNGGVSGRVRAEAMDEQTAQNLRAAVTGALAAGQLVSGRDSRLDAILKSIQVTGTGTTVAMSFTVPPEVFDMINGAAGLSNLLAPNTSTEPKTTKSLKQIVK